MKFYTSNDLIQALVNVSPTGTWLSCTNSYVGGPAPTLYKSPVNAGEDVDSALPHGAGGSALAT